MLTKASPDEKLIAQLFGTQPDSVVWFTPIFEKSTNSRKLVIDFDIKYCNVAACKLLGADADKIIGTTLLTSKLMDTASVAMVYEQCVKVWNSGEPIEFTYHSPGFDKYFNVQGSKVMDGILSITRDRTSEVMAEKEKEKHQLLLNKIVNNSPTSIMMCEALRNNFGAIYDFDIIMINDRIARDLKRSKEEIQSMTYCMLHPAEEANFVVTVLSSVIETGKAFYGELTLEAFGGWVSLSVDKLDDNKVIVTYLNIHESKLLSEKLAKQADWYNNILKHSSNGIIVLESVRNQENEIVDFEIKLANPSGLKMGNLPDDSVGKKICEVLPQLRQTGYFELHKSVVESGKPFSDLLPFHNGAKNGWYQVSLSKLNDGLVSNFMDVTELKNHETTIQEQAQLLNLILNSSLNGVYTLNAIRNNYQEIIDFEITHVNEVFCRMSGRTYDELIYKSFLKLFPDTKPTGIFNRNCNVLKTGVPVREEFFYKGDGVERWYDTSVSKVNEDKIVIAFNDITVLRSLAVQLQTTVEELKKSNERLSEFTHVASHDLNEPLRKISTYADLLNSRFGKMLDESAKDYVNKILRTTDRMQSLINDLLMFSQVSNSKQEFESIQLNTLIKDVLIDLETLINENNAEIILDKFPNIVGDKTQLRQIFQNLISNGIKFHKNQKKPQVQIRNSGEVERHQKKYLKIAVSDNGIGFKPSEGEKIFQLFQRLHNKNEFAGTGIGLAIVQKAMENHRGFIEVQSEPGIGSSFELFFEMKQ